MEGRSSVRKASTMMADTCPCLLDEEKRNYLKATAWQLGAHMAEVVASQDQCAPGLSFVAAHAAVAFLNEKLGMDPHVALAMVRDQLDDIAARQKKGAH